MKVVACAKVVPDPARPARLDPVTHRLARDAKLVLDEADTYGVEVALQLVAQAGEGEVVVVSMGPDDGSALRPALAMGAAGAVVVRDEALAGSDALATAKVLAAAIGRVGADVVVAATESSDGYTGTMPAQLAELLGLPSVTFCRRVSLEGGRLRAERQTEGGFDEVACPLPALITVTAGCVEPRYPSYKGIMGARSKPVEVLTVADLGLAAGAVGQAGARQEVVSVTPTAGRGAGEMVTDASVAHVFIVELLERLKVV
ncbi:MAG: electron transfer flavoprotein subunit beta/FixA family protein [Acidimicrobiales bacterium]